MKPFYNKPAKTLEEQADLLINRGLNINSREDLIKKLASVNYYKLRGYTYPYQDNTEPNSPFLPRNNWDEIWSDYVLDSRLRALLFESISHIETALKTQLTLNMSLGHEPTWYTDKDLFHNDEHFRTNFSELLKDWARSKEKFKEHYENDYNNAQLPPSWIIFETATYGVMSKYYGNLKKSVPEKDFIAQYFGFPHGCTEYLKSWLQNLNIVRNICAHHGRLFSRTGIVTPSYPTLPDNWLVLGFAHDKIYSSICVIKRLLDYCMPEYDFKTKLFDLISTASANQKSKMGFPAGWENEPLFR
ncbi:Abi family protein [Treponema sp.]|uniref:Abi family protein n=1 Tax=Treponema sp. TaxID=166 RepID=UPI003FD73E18